MQREWILYLYEIIAVDLDCFIQCHNATSEIIGLFFLSKKLDILSAAVKLSWVGIISCSLLTLKRLRVS